jgi:uncharacterized protein involved in exopolysaccharide biosynthesis
MADRAELEKLRQELAQDLAEAQAALPAHSIRPWQMQRVMDLEERLAEVKAQLKELGG